IVEYHGLLYVKGRLDYSSLATTTKTPLYLPRKSVLTDLIIYDYHRANLHAGVTTTLANVRVRYWFSHGRRTVATAIKRRCFDCRKMTNPAYSIPPWPALPTSRTETSRPFDKVGVDFYGPVMLKPMNLDGTPSKEVRKYYVCLFTCLSIRAVHCELMTDLSTAQFFHVFKRFAARRAYPSEVLSDNGTTFLAARQVIASILRARQGQPHASAAADLSPAHKSAATPAGRPVALASRTRKGAQRSCKRSAAGTPAAPHQARGNSLVTGLAVSNENLEAEEELFNFFTANNITWRTITERAAWKGGVYERMIGLIKSCLSKTLGRTRPNVDDYRTLLTQAEWVVNCRPISYISNTERDFTLVRPIDLLIPTLQGEQQFDFMDPDEDANAKDDPDYSPATAEDKFQRRLLKDLALARRLSDQFGKLFREGYLLDLSRQFGKKTPNARHLPTIGDIVLIYDENLPRTHWRYGLVMELHPSSDGVVREASVRLSETGHNTRRAVNHLFPLKPMLQEASRAEPPSDAVQEDDEPIPVLMAHLSLLEQPESMPNDQEKEKPPPSPSPAVTVPTLQRPPTSDAPTSGRATEKKKNERSRSSSKGSKEPRGTPRGSKGPRTPRGSPPKPQIVNDRPQRSVSQEARFRKQYGQRNPKNIKKDLRGRILINNEDWPMDGDLTRATATAEAESATNHSRDCSLSPQPRVRSQIIVPPPKTPTQRHSVSVPGRGRTSLVPASVALRRPPKPTVQFQRQPKSHKLVTVRRRGKARGTPRAEPMDISEAPTNRLRQLPRPPLPWAKTTTDQRRSTMFIGGKTPSNTKQYRDTCFDKVLKISTKKRITDPRSKVIPFVDTYVRKDMLTHGAQTAARLNQELPVTFEWHGRLDPEYMFAFGIAHFSHPASLVPVNLLAAVPTEHVPTVEECAADNATYDNGYLRGALYGCDPHLTFFTNLQVRHHIKQHILQNKDFTPVGIVTGLNYITPHIDHSWQSTEEMIQTQIAAYTDFVTYAMELHELKVYRPLCLNFDQPKKSQRNALDEGLDILRRLGLPRAYPIYLISWAGTPAQAWEWLRHYPRTTFGFTIEYITRLTDAGNLQFKRELPLNHIFPESFTP
ncbi:Pao retrotransposon peptidase family protein, partial [Aphelenchoides avenae]